MCHLSEPREGNPRLGQPQADSEAGVYGPEQMLVAFVDRSSKE